MPSTYVQLSWAPSASVRSFESNGCGTRASTWSLQGTWRVLVESMRTRNKAVISYQTLDLDSLMSQGYEFSGLTREGDHRSVTSLLENVEAQPIGVRSSSTTSPSPLSSLLRVTFCSSGRLLITPPRLSDCYQDFFFLWLVSLTGSFISHIGGVEDIFKRTCLLIL